MRPYRGKTKEGKWAKGGLYELNNRAFILQEYDIRQPSLFYGFNYPQENFSICLIEVDPKTVEQFVCSDKNGKDVFAGNKVRLKRGGFKSMKCKAIAGFKSWVWLYWKDHSTYYWENAHTDDIELIEKKKND